jgi:uncharacterized protein (DUF433 family)
MTFNWRDHMVRDPKICGGLPTMKGTRVLLRVVLANLAVGETYETLHEDYPSLTPDHIRAAIAFAADVAADDIPNIEMPAPAA